MTTMRARISVRSAPTRRNPRNLLTVVPLGIVVDDHLFHVVVDAVEEEDTQVGLEGVDEDGITVKMLRSKERATAVGWLTTTPIPAIS